MTNNQKSHVKKLLKADVVVEIPGTACELTVFKNTNTDVVVTIETMFKMDKNFQDRKSSRADAYLVTTNQWDANEECYTINEVYQTINVK